MTYHSDLSTFLSSVSTFLQYLRMNCSYHNSYVMQELAMTTQISYNKAPGIGLCCYKIEVINTKVLWSSPWNRRSLRCIHLHHENWFVQDVIVFLSSFVYPGLPFYEKLGWCFWKSRGRLPYRYTWSMLPVLSCSFAFVTLYVLLYLLYVLCCVCLFSMSGFVPESNSFDNR